MVRDNRRQFIKSVGATATVGLAGCLGGDGDGAANGSPDSTPGQSLTSVDLPLPEGTIYYPVYEAAVDAGVFTDVGLDVDTRYLPFDALTQTVTSGEVPTTIPSMIPYMGFHVDGQDLVTYGWEGNLQSINALYVHADSEYESIEDLEGERLGVWTFGSSTVQAFEILIAEETGLRMREDFETTTAAPPALFGLFNDGEIDAIINTSGFTITMEADPDTYRSIIQLNDWWIDRTGETIPLTSWWSYADWFDDNTELAASILEGASGATAHWRENVRDVLEEYGEPAGIESEEQFDVVEEWADEGQVYLQDTTQSYIDSVWELLELMVEFDFLEEVPEQESVLRSP